MTVPVSRSGPRVRPVLALVVVGAVALVLGGCAPTVAATPAADANDPLCAAVIVRLPDHLGELPARETDAQATGAWGDPAQVLLTCGVKPLAASALPCVTVDGVDWVQDDSRAPLYVFHTFGRRPAVDVAVRSTKVTGETVLTDLADAVKETRTTGHPCQ